MSLTKEEREKQLKLIKKLQKHNPESAITLTKEEQKTFDQLQAMKFAKEHKDSEVEVIKGKLVSIITKDANNNTIIIDDPKVVVGKRKGFKGLLAAIGIIKKEKFIGIIDKNGDFIKDKEKVNEVMSEIKGQKFAFEDANVKIEGTFHEDGNLHLPKNSKFDIDENIIVYKKDGKLAAIEHQGEIMDQYGTPIHKKNVYKMNNKYNNKLYFFNKGITDSIEQVREFDEVDAINAQKGIENLQKQPARSALKGARANEEAMKIGDELRKSMTPKQKHEDDRNVAKNIAAKARKNKHHTI